MLTDKKISAVVTCYNDAQAVPIMLERLHRVLAAITPNYEIIYVNDGSPDNAEQVLKNIAQDDKLLTVINHSRNFGSQSAFISGMKQSSGDAVIIMDGDLQDPPEMIEKFVKKWLEGYDAVYGVRKKREEKLFLRIAYKLFYRIFSSLSYIKIPLDVGDFSLIDKKIVDILVQMPERDIFIRGLRAWTGFKQTGIDYVRPRRMFGVTTNNLLKNIRWAKKGIFSFSYEPLELIFYLATITFAIAILALFTYIILYFINPNQPRGTTTIIVLILFFSSIQLLSISIIGEYLGKIFEEIKQRPKYIIKDIINDSKGHKPQQPS